MKEMITKLFTVGCLGSFEITCQTHEILPYMESDEYDLECWAELSNQIENTLLWMYPEKSWDEIQELSLEFEDQIVDEGEKIFYLEA